MIRLLFFGKLLLRYRPLLTALYVLGKTCYAAMSSKSPGGCYIVGNERRRINRAFWQAYEKALGNKR